MGSAELDNGDLISAGEQEGFSALITGDKNLRYQQNIQGRSISIITLNALFIDMPRIRPLVPKVLELLKDLPTGSFHEVEG